MRIDPYRHLCGFGMFHQPRGGLGAGIPEHLSHHACVVDYAAKKLRPRRGVRPGRAVSLLLRPPPRRLRFTDGTLQRTDGEMDRRRRRATDARPPSCLAEVPRDRVPDRRRHGRRHGVHRRHGRPRHVSAGLSQSRDRWVRRPGRADGRDFDPRRRHRAEAQAHDERRAVPQRVRAVRVPPGLVAARTARRRREERTPTSLLFHYNSPLDI
mmetsp:Transcript_15168/g.47148  ORF Transcript_15168/g.47148 Transcript_15168/m.47148 type:complete len:211 (-) Transcript_15168:14-646(-)